MCLSQCLPSLKLLPLLLSGVKRSPIAFPPQEEENFFFFFRLKSVA